MTKIQFLVDNGINGITNKLSDCTNFLRRIAMNENNENFFEQIEDYKNVVYIIELLLIILFSNATLEWMFSQVDSVKTDFGNWLSQEYLDHWFRISEECPGILT